MKKRVGDPWVSPPVYGRSLRGLGINLLVRDTERTVAFVRDVLGLEIVYSDPDLAVFRHGGQEWMVHADHTYDAHPLLPRTRVAALRGGGVELRVHDVDPDVAVAAALAQGYEVLEPADNKPHGLREAYILDADGYVWVVDMPSLSKWAV
jgi:catechol 2,3-dioxygenase-like lactoylglutathione lyase family enzyme